MARAAPSEQRKVAAALRDADYSWAEIAGELNRLYGVVGIAAMRLAHTWTQADLAEQWNRRWPSARPVTAGTISGWERTCAGRASRRAPSLKVLGCLAELCSCAAGDLLIGVYDHREDVSIAAPDSLCGMTEVPRPNRRTMIAALGAAGAAFAARPLHIGRVGAADVERLRADYWQLWHQDQNDGGGAVYGPTVALLDHVQTLRDQGSYSLTVGRDLQVLIGLLQDHAAFTSYDAGDHVRARMLWQEGLTTARLADDAHLETYIAAEMANQAQWLGQGRETVELTELAQRLSRGWASPKLSAVLSCRLAEGHAMCGNASAARAALGNAEAEMTDATDDGTWTDYFTVEMLGAGAARTLLAVDAPVAAERAARASVSSRIPRRPRAMNCAQHARILLAAGQLDQAHHVAGEADTLAEGISSARLTAELASMHQALASA